MNTGFELALTRPWWVWKDKRIRTLIANVHLAHWVPLVADSLRSNKLAGRQPATWQELADVIERDFRNVNRWRRGRYKLTNQDILGLSFTLNIPVASFFPSLVEWIERATCMLCKPDVTCADAHAYALYRAAHPVYCNPRLDPTAIESVIMQSGPSHRAVDVETAIKNVATNLGKILPGLRM